MISVTKQNGSDNVSNTGQVTETYEAEKKSETFARHWLALLR